MVRIPHIKIPSVRVGGIDPTSDIGTGTVAPIPPEELYAYGVQWDKAVENPDVTRIGNMELHRANKLPVQNAMRGCLLDDNGNVVQHLSDSDWQNASLLDGSHGQVMIEIPTFYWKFSEDENGIQSVMLSMVEIAGYKKVNKMYVSAYEATMDRTNTMLASVKSTDARYRGGNNNSAWDGTYRSLLGKAATNISLTEFRTYARNRKANSCEWNCNTYQVQKILYWLFVVEYATRNSQKAYNSSLTSEGYRQGGLGAGVTNANDSKWNSEFSYYPFVPIGITDSLGNGTGEVSYSSVDSSDSTWVTVKVPRYRGIENPFGHVWKWTDGINIQVQSDNDGGKSKVYVSDDPATWNSSNYNGYTYIGDEARTNNWIKEIIFGEDGDIIPTIVGSSSQYFTDYHYTNIPNSGNVLRGLRFGGRANLGSLAGFVCSGSASAPSNRAAPVGSRLCFVPHINHKKISKNEQQYR